jgi:hypothetical protein
MSMTHTPSFPIRVLLFLIAILHWAVVPYGLLAWLWPHPIWLAVHLVFIPAIIIQWQVNNGVCVLNSLESWLRTGQWRDEEDTHQGGWVSSILARYVGISLSDTSINWLVYGLLGLSWVISLVRILGAA